MKKTVLVIIGILLAAVLISGCTQAPQTESRTPQAGTEIPFKTIAKGEYSGYKEKANLVINDAEELAQQLGVNLSAPITPEDEQKNNFRPNFSKETVIAVFMGQKNTGGYSIEIKKIVVEIPACPEKTLCKVVPTYVAYYKETAPQRGSLVTQALTQPYHIVKTQKLGKVEFKKSFS